MERTWWFRLTAGDTANQVAVCAAEAEEAVRIAKAGADNVAPRGVKMDGPFPHEDFAPCSGCPYRDPCALSHWDRGRRWNEERPWTFEGWSSVHTCKLCMERVIDFHMGEYAKRRNPVPSDCPRWNLTFGSAVECEGCRQERDALREAHPRYHQACEAAGATFLSMLTQRQNEKDGTADLASRRERKEALTALTAAWNPLDDLRAAAEDPETAEDMRLASELYEAFMRTLVGRPEFIEEWERARDDGEVRIAVWGLEMLEGLYLAVRRHRDDVPALVHEWLFAFTDKVPNSRAWGRTSVDDLRELIGRWETLAREVEAGVVRIAGS